MAQNNYEIKNIKNTSASIGLSNNSYVDGLNVEWTFDGQPAGTGNSITFDPSEKVPGPYTVAASVDYPIALSDSLDIGVVKVALTNDIAGCPHCLDGYVFYLSDDSYIGDMQVEWTIEPDLLGGATVNACPTNNLAAIFSPGELGQNYTITAKLNGFDCSDTTEVRVFVPGLIDQKFSLWTIRAY